MKRKYLTRNIRSGFTLIELLVVIAIIGILATYVLASLSSARLRSRDAKRIASVREIQKALDLYFDSNRTFPAAVATCDASNAFGLDPLATSAIFSQVPRDPNGGDTENCYMYGTPTGAEPEVEYHIGISLEDSTVNALTLDRDYDSSAAGANYTVNGFDGADGGKCYASHPGFNCYDSSSN